MTGCIQPSEPAELRNDYGPIGDADAATDASDLKPPSDASDAAPVTPLEDGGDVPTGKRPEMLSFEVTTKALGGTYAPRNIGAIWVEDAAGNWLKTLSVWAGVRERYLSRFREAAEGNRVDAITSATRPSHMTTQVQWDLRDVSREPVPDGSYRLVLEMTDRNGSGASLEIAFEVGAESFEMSPPDEPNFFAMKLRLR